MNIVIIGSGNIATHLAKRWHVADNTIIQIYSRTLASAQALANVVSSRATNSLSELDPTADLYIIAVSDSAIIDIVQKLPTTLNGIVVHTSGATELDILAKFNHYGVIYPPQSISKDIETDLSVIPFGIEGNTPKTFDTLFTLMVHIAPKTFPCSSKQRLALHLTAVIANNFSNALFQMANEILEKENLNFDLLKPIILETAIKVQNNSPLATQTGPARRGDRNVIQKHLQFLSHSPEESKIYQAMTDFIIKRFNK